MAFRNVLILLAVTLTASLLPTSLTAGAKAQGGFVCTEFIGYSQMGSPDHGGWGPYAAQVMVAGGPDTVQLRWIIAGAAFRWAMPGYEGWNIRPTSPCTQSSSAPDRVILDITHNEYLTPARTNGDPVGFIETRIRGFLAQARARYPSARSFVLQPVVGGPGHTTCPISTAPEQGVVRASYNHPHIHEAILRIVGGNVSMGYDSAVRSCADYADWEGHLVSSASQPIGAAIGGFYRNGGSSDGTAPPPVQGPPAVVPPPSPVPAPQTPPVDPPSVSAAPAEQPPPDVAPPAPDARVGLGQGTPDATLWLVVLAPTPTYSLQLEPTGMAGPGDWYRVAQVDGGWALGVWELDPPESLVWIALGPDVALTAASDDLYLRQPDVTQRW
jgi:hypothetical protein